MLVVIVQSTVINDDGDDGVDCGMDTGIVRGIVTGIVRGMDTGMDTGIVRGTRLVGVGTGPVLVDLKQDRPSALQEKPGAQMAKAHLVILPPPLVVGVGAIMGIILGAGPATGVGTCIDRGMIAGADGMTLVGVVGGVGLVPPADRKHDIPSALQVKPGAQLTLQLPLVVGIVGKGPDTGGRGAGATTGGRGAGATTGVDRGMEPLYAMTKKEADASAAHVVTPPLLGNCDRPATKAVAL
jgi:hypothetical protein